MFEAIALSIALSITPATTNLTPPALTTAAESPVMSKSHLPYTGKYVYTHQQEYTLCVLKRESNNHWFSTNRSGGYAGGFQFSYALTKGATWMMAPELKTIFGKKTGKELSIKLRAIPMQKWSPFYQHMAFSTVLNWNGPYSGKHHWAGGRFACLPS